MVTYEQVRQGVVTYITNHLAPLMPKVQAIGVLAFAPTIIDAHLPKLLQTDLLKGTNLVDGTNIDIDEVYRLVKAAAVGKYPVELFGFRFTENDLDTLYKCIMEV